MLTEICYQTITQGVTVVAAQVLIVMAVFLVVSLATLWLDRRRKKAQERMDRVERELHEARLFKLQDAKQHR